MPHDASEPLAPTEARRRIRAILENGTVHVSQHAWREMANDALDMVDCANVLRGGVVGPPDHMHGTWRYRVSTPRICVVVAFQSVTDLVIVTAWRSQS